MINENFEIIYISGKRKTISISVSPKCEVVCKYPKGLSLKVVRNFIEGKNKWINEKMLYNRAVRAKYEDLINYEAVSVLGKLFDTKFVADMKKVKIIDNSIYVKNYDSLVKFIKTKTKEIIIERIKYLFDILNIESKEIKITNSKRQWGNCNSNGRISINFRAGCLPNELLDYVLLHEITHLKYMNHSKQFWNELDMLCPNSKILNVNLKQYNFVMELYRNRDGIILKKILKKI